MNYAKIPNNITFQGEYGENPFIEFGEPKCFDASNRLWRRSQDERVLFATYRGSKGKGRNVQEVGEIQ